MKKYTFLNEGKKSKFLSSRSFMNMDLFVYGDFHRASITMHRIGRDNTIINFDPSMHDSNSIVVLDYGEVDCRNHIKKQTEMGRDYKKQRVPA